MAKRKQPGKQVGGPYLAAAFFCERAIEDKDDNALSAIRMVDQMTFLIDPSAPPNFPSETHRLPIALTGVVSFKTGNSPGEHKLRIVMESPSGKMAEPLELPVSLSPQPHGGANVRFQNTILVKKGGLFWFHVFLDDKEVTRMPLEIRVVRSNPAAPAGPTGDSAGGDKNVSAK